MEPIRLEWAGEQDAPGYYVGAGDHGWSSGAGPADDARPACHGCGRPVEWRDLRYGFVEEDGRVLVRQDGDAWHGPCRVRARGVALAAAGRDLVGAVGVFGRAVGRGVATIGASGVPVLVDRGRAAVAAAADLVAAGRVEARRRVRRLPLDRLRAPVEWGAGIVLGGAGHVGWRLDLVRARVVAAHAEWRRGVGYTRAWRVALDGEQSPEVVALRQDERDRRNGWVILPGGERFRPGSPAGEAAADGSRVGGWVDPSSVRRAFEEQAGPEFRRAFLNGWIGPAGHGDVDTPRER